MDANYGAVNGEEANKTSPSDSLSDLIEKPKTKLRTSKDYPYSVLFILSNEFCERFSFYGMRAILVLYLTKWLLFDANQATSIYHAFIMLCYSMPLIGAVIADGYLGRYSTILYLSVVYFLGNVVLSTTALPPREWYGAAIGMFLIACGTGGIKASVAPFGADQFVPGQERWRNSFFSAFYFMINLGSVVSILITPILRADVQCFGGDCYVLAFGIPAVLMFLSLILFFCGRNKYRKIPPAGNVIGKTFKCIYYAVVGRIRRNKYDEPRPHWLYYADDKYDKGFIEDVRRLLKVLTMFLPLPVFWALSDQQGSRWTLQAEHMDGDMGLLGQLKPDQMQALNPLLIVALIPLFDKVIYPLLDKCKIPNRPLQRMVVGLYISSVAFVAAGLVQLKIDNAEEVKLQPGEAGLTFINTLPCDVKVKSLVFNGDISEFEMSDFTPIQAGNYSVFEIDAVCNNTNKGEIKKATVQRVFSFDEMSAYRMIIHFDKNGNLNLSEFPDKRKPKNGNVAVSVFITEFPDKELILEADGKLRGSQENVGTLFRLKSYQATNFEEMEPNNYKLYVTTIRNSKTTLQDMSLNIQLKSGGVYTMYLHGNRNKTDVHLYVDVDENMVPIFWMVPQYVLITVGEVLFSISGLSFAYTQSPASMKSVVQAIWLLTVAFGDLVVIIVANIHAIPNQMIEFFIFAAIMFLDTVIFMIMAMCYTYKPNSLDYHELPEEDAVEIDMTETRLKGIPDGEDHPLHHRNMVVNSS